MHASRFPFSGGRSSRVALTSFRARGASRVRSDFLKAYQYVNTVKLFRDREVVSQVRRCAPRAAASANPNSSPPHRRMPVWPRRDLEKHDGLHQFEVAQLGNLCPADWQEARTLIPSLALPGRNIDVEKGVELLDQLNGQRQYRPT